MSETAVTVRDRMLTMSDGVRLFTRIVLPGDGRGTYPTVFHRSPYRAETEITEETYRKYGEDPFLLRGCAVVFQHCRGRFGSEGECIPYSKEERQDGLDTLALIRKMPHYNGEIFLRGGSYSASVLMLMLDEPMPDVKGICFSVQTESMYHRNFLNGLCRSFSGFSWWLSMISGQHPRIAGDQEIYVRPYRDLMRRAIGRDIPEFTDTLMNDRYNDFWKNDHRRGIMENLTIPLLLVGGWYDYYCFGMCRMWEKLPPETRAKSCFLMGPWGHSTHVREPGDYPLPGGDLPADREAAWFDSVRTGKPFPYGRPGTFRYYTVGDHVWREAESPYETAPGRRLFLTAGGGLSPRRPAGSRRSFVYDPEAVTARDRHDDLFLCYDPGTYDDVLSFVSSAFPEDVRFFGPLRIRGELSSDCDDTSFFFRVYLVEDGKSYNLVDCATTLLHADETYRRGQRCRVDLLTQPTAFLVKRGCRIRLDISSYSNCFVPHANTARHFALETKTKVAENTVFFGQTELLLPEVASS